MRVALISCFGYYEQRLRFVKEAFEKEGHEVHIFFSDFDHINKEKITNKMKGIEYISVKPYYKNLSLSRIYSHYRFARSVYKKIYRESFDLIYAIIPPNTLCSLLKKYKKHHSNAKLIYDVYDLWPESFTNKKIEKLAYPFFIIWKNQRNKSLDVADYVVTECDLYQDVLQNFVKGNKIRTIYLSKDCSDIQHTKHKVYKNDIHVCYLGSINNIIHTELIRDFLVNLNTYKKVVLEVIGKGETKNHFLSEMRNAGIQYIDHGALYGNEKSAVLKQCHFGINMMVDEVKVGLTMKSIDYFEYCLPLLNNIKGDTWKLIEIDNIGFNIRSDNLKTIAKQVAALDEESYNEMMERTKAVFNDKFSSASFHILFHEIIKKCCG